MKIKKKVLLSAGIITLCSVFAHASLTDGFKVNETQTVGNSDKPFDLPIEDIWYQPLIDLIKTS